jgi:hypothetical protein
MPKRREVSGSIDPLSLYDAAYPDVIVMDHLLGLLIGVGIAAATEEGRPWRSDFRQTCQSEVAPLCPNFFGIHLQGINSLDR